MNNKQIRYAFKRVLEAADNARCSDIHHEDRDKHERGEVCLAEYALNRQAYLIREYMKTEHGIKV